MEKIYKGVKIYLEGNVWCCYFDDYIETRKKQGKKWSEESFCNWCDDNKLHPRG